ncbi:MAG: hypothetical protein Ta2E_07510 [Mycoplasmoidaceae bacterium]|nr:MAG: hypothetical protein Ta2E_07510 [Mycoplasmoidaceae bacterium]
MANIKANIKSVRKNKKRTIRNKIIISSLKNSIKQNRNNPNQEVISTLYKKSDSALAKGKISKNKANRIKSRAAILINKSKADATKK